MNLPPVEEIELLPTHMLAPAYHTATISGTQCITHGQFRMACRLYKYAVIARVTAANRYGNLDPKHKESINDLIIVIRVLEMLGEGDRFVFTTGRLVGEAMDNNIYVPEHMRPAGWSYMQYRHDNAAYIARDELRRGITA